MAAILVVDDSTVHRCLAGSLLKKRPGWTVAFAEDGNAALTHIREANPDLVVTDLQMPGMDGLELVEAIRRDHPSIPVVLMTGHGSEEIAVAALRRGASGYVPKKNLECDLVQTVDNLLAMTLTSRNDQRVLECLAESEYHFVVSNDASHIQPLIGHFQDLMRQMNLVDKSGLIRVGTALREAMVNAIEHGNLELRSELRDLEDRQAYQRMATERRNERPYRDRHIRIRARFCPDQVVYAIRDEGPGFDSSHLPDPTDPANLEKVSGRGLFLIRTFMDEVHFNPTGNEIVMTKRRKEDCSTKGELP